MLKARVLTAVPLAFILLVIIVFAPPIVFLGLVLVIALMGAWEWAALGGWKSKALRVLYMAILGACLGVAFFLPEPFDAAIISLACIGWLALFALVLRRGILPEAQPLSPIIRLILGVPLLLATVLALTEIHAISTVGAFYLIVLLGLVWGADIGAYFAGRRYGKHKLAPLISPGKTWGGVGGGIIVSLFGLVLASIYGAQGLGYALPPVYWWLLMGPAVIIASVFGDLFESILKRDAGVKDSGSILPGHGGVLDRIDALLPAAPLFYLALLGGQ